MNDNVDIFVETLDKFSISLDEQQINQFLRYYEILIERNKVMNLTTITSFTDVLLKHFVDSLSIVQVFDFYSFRDTSCRIIDVGTGAGFPGIPLKIAFPWISVTLADSLQKRIRFLDDVICTLDLEHIETVHGRAEELGRNKNYRENFDLCVSRAVANLTTLSEYCMPFVREGGRFISYKSGDIDEEVSDAEHAITLLGGKIEHIFQFCLADNARSFIVIEKSKSTPNLYPRKAGTPSRNPLL